MKIGIMTMHRIANYGSFMQAYSLKSILEKMGHEVIFVDYKVEPDIYHKDDSKEKIVCTIKNVRKKIRATTFGAILLDFIKKFNKDKLQMIEKNNKFFSCNYMLGVTDKMVYRPKLDMLVIGSDEVFNCTQPGYNVGYSLELFGKDSKAKKVISYAASFGNTTIDVIKKYKIDKELGTYLDKMYSLSVRDENSRQIVEAISSKETFTHLDPVLVGYIENETWEEVHEENYIILYGYEYRFSMKECEDIMKYAEEKRLKVISLGEKQHLYDKYICCRPNEVLSYFRNAACIFTDTFHGTIFSVITHKPFVTIARNQKGGNNQKIVSLMDSLGLEERLVKNFKNVEATMAQCINYDVVDEIREKERQRTINYLVSCINGD